MSGDGSLRYWSHKDSHSSSHHRNDDEISKEEGLEVSLGDERRGHRSLEKATITQVIAEVVGIGILRAATLTLVIMDYIMVLMLVEVDLGKNIPSTIPIATGEHELTLKVEVDMGLRPSTLTPTTHLNMVYF